MQKMRYLIQKRAAPAQETLQEDFKKNDIPAARKHLEALLALIKLEHLSGIYDTDIGFLHNMGFNGDNVIHYDIGKIKTVPENETKEDYLAYRKQIAQKMSAWFEKYAPQSFKEELQIPLNNFVTDPND